MKTLLSAWLVLLLLTLAPAGASADSAATTPMLTDAMDVSAVVGARPNTLFVSWRNRGEVWLGEWSIGERRFLAKRKAHNDGSSVLPLKRNANRLVLSIQGDKQRTEIHSYGFDLEEKKSVVLPLVTLHDYAHLAALDVNDAFILAGHWELRAPRRPAVHVGEDLVLQATKALSLHVIDAASMKVVGARVFEGDHLLMPFLNFEKARPARLGVGENVSAAFVALPEEDRATVMRVTLPSLKTEKEQVLTGLPLTRASVDLDFALAANHLVARSVDRHHVLSATTLAPMSPPRDASFANEEEGLSITAFGQKHRIIQGEGEENRWFWKTMR